MALRELLVNQGAFGDYFGMRGARIRHIYLGLTGTWGSRHGCHSVPGHGLHWTHVTPMGIKLRLRVAEYKNPLSRMART
jgi:hypothetical protein